jgi:hypothetical protein
MGRAVFEVRQLLEYLATALLKVLFDIHKGPYESFTLNLLFVHLSNELTKFVADVKYVLDGQEDAGGS